MVASSPASHQANPQAALQLAVSCQGLTKGYGEADARVLALRGVDLQIPVGGMTMLVGPSGCGKTTLISIIAGLLQPDEGQCTVLDKPLKGLAEERLARWRRRHVGFVFQSYNLLPGLSARENVALPLLMRGVDRVQALAKADDRLARVGLGDKAHLPSEKMSGGQQQRVAIARALVQSPKLLVCDEPTSALDSQAGEQVMQLLKRVSRHPGRTVIVVTHDQRVMRYADRIATMSDGVITQVQERTGTRARLHPVGGTRSSQAQDSPPRRSGTAPDMTHPPVDAGASPLRAARPATADLPVLSAAIVPLDHTLDPHLERPLRRRRS